VGGSSRGAGAYAFSGERPADPAVVSERTCATPVRRRPRRDDGNGGHLRNSSRFLTLPSPLDRRERRHVSPTGTVCIGFADNIMARAEGDMAIEVEDQANSVPATIVGHIGDLGLHFASSLLRTC